MTRSQLFRLGVSAIVASACGTSQPAPAPVVARPKAVVTAAPPPPPTSSLQYAYNPVGKRDPFRAPGPAARLSGEAEETPLCSEALCQYKLDELTVVAVMSGDANPAAMVEDRAGMGFLVHRFSKVGKEGGQVTAISRECLTVTAYVSGVDGKARPSRTEMCVRPDQRNAPVLDYLTGKPRP